MLQILPRYPGGLRVARVRAMFVVSVLLSAGTTQAQVAHGHSSLSRPAATLVTGSPATVAASPLPLTVAASPLPFESTLLRYKPMTDQKLGSWRDANDTVTRIGGWRSYLKEVQTPDAKTTTPAASSATPATPAAANPHAGHGVKP